MLASVEMDELFVLPRLVIARRLVYKAALNFKQINEVMANVRFGQQGNRRFDLQ